MTNGDLYYLKRTYKTHKRPHAFAEDYFGKNYLNNKVKRKFSGEEFNAIGNPKPIKFATKEDADKIAQGERIKGRRARTVKYKDHWKVFMAFGFKDLY